MRTAVLGICLSGFIASVLPSPANASIEYRSKADGSSLFQSEKMDPPPLAMLEKGQSVQMLHQGATGSFVKTGSGLKGWMRNGDLERIALPDARTHRIGDQSIEGGGEFAHSFWLIDYRNPDYEALPLDRTFLGEVAEAIDREQVEMKNEEN